MLALKLATVAALCSISVLGFTYTIGVGMDEVTGLPGVGFDPSRTVTQGIDDTLVFRLLGGNHQIVSADFDYPCTQSGTFDTGIVAVPNGTLEAAGPEFNVTVANSSMVMYFADIAGDNCYQGAVLCINTNETDPDASCTAFKAKALALGAQMGVATSVRSNLPASTSTSSASSATSAISTGAASKTATGAAASATASTKSSAAGKVVVGVVGGLAALAGVLALI